MLQIQKAAGRLITNDSATIAKLERLLPAAVAHEEAGRLDEAENLLQAALRISPNNGFVLNQLAVVHQKLRKYDTSRQLLQNAVPVFQNTIRLVSNPSKDLFTGLINALTILSRTEEALAVDRQRRRHWQSTAREDFDYAFRLLGVGNYKEGWRHHEARYQGPMLRPAWFDRPRWDGRQLDGETVLLWAEQGLGDTIQFARYAPLVAARGGRVVLLVQGQLVRLLRSLPGVAAIFPQGGWTPPADLHCPLMSLPFVFGTTLETIPVQVPYLHGDATRWQMLLDRMPGLKVGLVWAGRKWPGSLGAVDALRSLHLSDLEPLLDTPGCSFVSLQVGDTAGEVADFHDRVFDVSGRLQNFQDTADLIAGLDLVISVDTSVAHLAGAMGKPVWLLNRQTTCWRWLLHRTDSPWYPTMRVYRQERTGDWAPVIGAVARDLAELAAPHVPKTVMTVEDQLKAACDALMAGRKDEAIWRFRQRWVHAPGTDVWKRSELAKTLLALGCLTEGFEEFARPWIGKVGIWQGESPIGKTIVVDAFPRNADDPGFGDVIMFVRYVQLLAERGAKVVLSVLPALKRLLEHLPCDVITEPPGLLPFDHLRIPLFALPHAFRTNLDNIPAEIPYLRGDPAPWADVLAEMPGMKVGLVWAGRRGERRQYGQMDDVRSTTLAQMAPLLDVPGCSFVSLQLGPPADQVRAFPAVRDVAHRLRDWTDTAGLMTGLDIIVTVDSAPAHLAGALGRPVWLMDRYGGCWRWLLNRDDSPWYPTMRLFRQPKPGDWETVVADMVQALHTLAG